MWHSLRGTLFARSELKVKSGVLASVSPFLNIPSSEKTTNPLVDKPTNICGFQTPDAS